jgi:hypothetical protein
MGFEKPFLIHVVIVSLPDEYGNLVSSYNNMKDKWSIDELISHVVFEEETLKKANKDHVNQVDSKRKFHGKGENYARKNKPHFSNSKHERGESSRPQSFF